MKKQLLKSALIAVAGVGLLAGSGWADNIINPAPGSESSLQKIIDATIFGGTVDNKLSVINVDTDQSDVSAWNLDEVNADAYLISVFTAGSGKLGVASADLSKEYTFDLGTSSALGASSSFWLDGNDLIVQIGNTPTKVKDDFGTTFTFYYELTNGTKYYAGSTRAVTYFVESGLNVKVPLHNVSQSTGNNDWVIAFEDGKDFDFNDAVFYLEDLKAVPEPTTMLLFGTGLIGLAGIARRKKNQ